MNPYITGNWVAGPQFYGREALCQSLAASGDRCIYLIGMRRVGKTSLLRRLAEQLAPHALYCDLMQAAASLDGQDSLDEARLIRLLRRELGRLAAASPQLEALRATWDQSGTQICPWLEDLAWAAEEQGLRLTLLWDEAEMLRRLPSATLMCLRGLLQHSQGLRLIICASKGLASINDRWRDEGSPFLFGFRSYALSMLSDAEASALIRQRGQVEATPAVITAIGEATGNHPYLTQLLCDRLYEQGALRPPAEVDLLLDDSLADLCRIDVAQLSPGERAVLRALAACGPLPLADLADASELPAEAAHSFARSLSLTGYLRPARGGGWRVGNRFLERWLTSNSPPAAPAVTDRASLEVGGELVRLHGEIGALEQRLRASQDQLAPQGELLSERELTVLRLLAVGRRNSEIANQLIVSPNTVKAHIKQIYRKLGASDRVQAINAARQRGLIG
jgi:DNA-binding CsgD family transcriptional regulator